MSGLDLVPPILAALHCAVNFASAIEATVHREIDIGVVRSREKHTGSTISLFVGGHGRRRRGGAGGGARQG